MRGKDLLEAMQLVDIKYLQATDCQHSAKRRHLTRSLALAACLCFLIVAACVMIAPTGNSFAVIAYAAETAQDGEVTLRETNLLTSSSALGGYYDGEIMYFGLGLQCRGRNLKSVTFQSTDGVFATQPEKEFSDMHPLTDMQVSENRVHILPPTAFDVRGETLMLDSEISSDLLVFWGSAPDKLPKTLLIEATAVFTDGQTQSAVISIDLSNNPIVMSLDKEALPYLYFSFSGKSN